MGFTPTAKPSSSFSPDAKPVSSFSAEGKATAKVFHTFMDGDFYLFMDGNRFIFDEDIQSTWTVEAKPS